MKLICIFISSVCLLLISLGFPVRLDAYAASPIVEINTQGIKVYPFGTYLSFIRTQDGRIYGIEELGPFQQMKWDVGDNVEINGVAQVIQGQMFKISKVLLYLRNLDKDEIAVVILLKHPTSQYLHSSIQNKDDQEEKEFANDTITLNDGRVYKIVDLENFHEEEWLPGDALEEDAVVYIDAQGDEAKPVVRLHNLNRDKEIEAILIAP